MLLCFSGVLTLWILGYKIKFQKILSPFENLNYMILLEEQQDKIEIRQLAIHHLHLPVAELIRISDRSPV